jgi:outer membrane protein TolC
MVQAGFLLLSSSPAAGLTLEEAINLALTRNERAAAADEETRAAEARVGQARSFLLPDLTLLGDYTRRTHETTRTVGGVTTLQSREAREARLNLEQTLFDAQAWPLLQSAKRAREAARYDARDTKRLLAYETAETFLTVLAADRVARAAAERLELAERNREEVQVRFGAQLVGSNDVTLAELEAASAEREVVRVRGLARTARLNLGQLLAVEVAESDSLTVPGELIVAASRPVAEFPVPKSQAVERRPDVQAERARTAAAHSIATEPLMRYLPDLDFLGTAWSTNDRGANVEDPDWTVGLGLTWELFDGFQRESERSERAALARAAELDLAHLERRVEVDVETAQVAVESQQASLARSEVAVDAARRNLTETSELYRRGLVRAFEVVDANVQLFEAEVERTGAQYELGLAYLDLRAAVGLDPLDSIRIEEERP